jgi:hypothetical protein
MANMVQKCVGEGIDMTHPNVGFSDMSAQCRQMSAKINFLESISTQQCGGVVGG